MAIKNRHRWLGKRLEDAFSVPSDEALAMVRANMARVNDFFSTADDRLFVFHQPIMKQLGVRHSNNMWLFHCVDYAGREATSRRGLLQQAKKAGMKPAAPESHLPRPQLDFKPVVSPCVRAGKRYCFAASIPCSFSQEADWEATSSEPVMQMTEGGEMPLAGKAVYFLNAAPPKKSINLDVVSLAGARAA